MLARNLTRNAKAMGMVARKMSTPKQVIAQNMVLLKNLSEAKTEAEFESIYAAAPVAVDTNALPAEFAHLKSYFDLDSVTSAVPFTPDPTAWQNKSFGAFAVEEAQREETWPFLAGCVVTFMLFFAFNAALPAEGKKTSRYWQLLESHEEAAKIQLASGHH